MLSLLFSTIPYISSSLFIFLKNINVTHFILDKALSGAFAAALPHFIYCFQKLLWFCFWCYSSFLTIFSFFISIFRVQ